MKTRKNSPMRRALGLLLIVALWAPVGVVGAAHLWGWLLGAHQRKPSVLANHPLNVSRISISSGQDGEPSAGWKFAVLGDLGKRYEIFSGFLSQMKQDDIRFVILCGDLAYRITPEQYEYLHAKITQAGFDRPIFAAIGNHDVVAKDDYRLFRGYIGGPHGTKKIPLSRDLSYGDPYRERFAFVVPEQPPFAALFILFDNLFGPPDSEQLLWIERLLKTYRSRVKHVFLFGHVPIVKAPKRIQKVPSKDWLLPYERFEQVGQDRRNSKLVYELIKVDRAAEHTPFVPLTPIVDSRTKRVSFYHPLLLEGYDRVYELLDRYKVTAVFSGDLHGYARYQIGSTLHFVSGGGGAPLQYPEALHHYLEVNVGSEGISVRPVVRTTKARFTAKLEQFLIAEVFLPLVRRPWLYLALFFWLGAALVLPRFLGSFDRSKPANR